MDEQIVLKDKAIQILPESIIAQFRAEEQDRRNEQTSKDIVRQRPGKQGQTWDYITRIDAMKFLDRYYPKLWSFRIVPDSFKQFMNFVYVLGELTVIDPKTGLQRTVQSYGCDEGETKKNSDELVSLIYIKNAEADALKRCCVYLGGFNDVYSDETEYGSSKATDDDLVWFLDSIMSRLAKKYKSNELEARSLFMTVNGFLRGDISKDKLIRAYLSNN